MLHYISTIFIKFKKQCINKVNCYISHMPLEMRRIINFFNSRFTRRDTSVNVSRLFSHIHGLPYSEEGRFFRVGEENFLSTIVDSSDYPIRIRFGITRKGGLPLVEENGPPQPLELGEDAGLYEPIHAIIFENGIIGAEYNHFGPRLPRLSDYLQAKFPDHVDNVEILPLMKPGIESEVERMGGIRMFRLKLNKDIVSYAQRLDSSIYDMFNAAMAVNNQIEDVEVILRAKPRHYFDMDEVKRKIPLWLTSSEAQSGIEKFQVDALDNEIGKTGSFDLLMNYIRSDKRVVQLDPRYRCVNSASMYGRIIEAYGELQTDINRVLNVR
jgi:hypothetical protein